MSFKNLETKLLLDGGILTQADASTAVLCVPVHRSGAGPALRTVRLTQGTL